MMVGDELLAATSTDPATTPSAFSSFSKPMTSLQAVGYCTPEEVSDQEFLEAQDQRRIARKKYKIEHAVFRPPDDFFDDADKEKKSGSHDEEGAFTGPQFTPRLYRQRYDKAIDIVRQYGKKIRKVVDFGCSEAKWVERARRALPEVKYLVGVDVDGPLLQETSEDNVDLDSDDEDFFYDRRPQSLNVQLFEGSIIEYDQRLADIDAAVCIEIIEHLYPEVLEEVPEAILGQLRPFVAIFTTPNQDFNQLFNIEKGKFRHWDHKFEWTRSEFQIWVDRILIEYPEYEVEIDGLGFAEDRKDLGGCSQVAIFTMKCGIKEYIANIQPQKIQLAKECDDTCPVPYKLIYKMTFPFDPAGNRREHLSNICTSFISGAANWDADRLEMIEHCGHKYCAVPLKQIYKAKGVKRLCRGIEDLRKFLLTEGFFYDDEKVAILHCLDESDHDQCSNEEEEEDYQDDALEDNSKVETETDNTPSFKGGFGWS